MPYRRLGPTGLKVSVLSFGSWVSFGTQLDTGMARDCLAAAREAGVNFFDNAEAYAGGESERIMGRAISELNWPRETYVVSSKFFWGLTEGVNTRNTLNRKYLMHAIDGSLERFGLEFLDVIFCHRPDPDTPIEETVEAMSDIIESGRAHYWGVSEWSADEIRAAWDVADKRNLRKPVTEQPQYHLFERRKVEREYARLYEDIGLGLTTWSPLASGLLTGKYLDGVPDDSRAALPVLQSDARLDLMVSDVGLPGLDGRKLAEIARQHRPDLKILFVTGYAQHARVRDEFLGKDMDMLTKPFALDALGHKIREMLS